MNPSDLYLASELETLEERASILRSEKKKLQEQIDRAHFQIETLRIKSGLCPKCGNAFVNKDPLYYGNNIYGSRYYHERTDNGLYDEWRYCDALR